LWCAPTFVFVRGLETIAIMLRRHARSYLWVGDVRFEIFDFLGHLLYLRTPKRLAKG
jgi:hypothetical protein